MLQVIDFYGTLFAHCLKTEGGSKRLLYLSFFEFVHNVRRLGRALLGALVENLLQPETCPQKPNMSLQK